MNRRKVIQNIVLTSAVTIFITSCVEANVIELIKDGMYVLDKNHLIYES